MKFCAFVTKKNMKNMDGVIKAAYNIIKINGTKYLTV